MTVGLLLFAVIILLNPKSTKREVSFINSSSEPVEIKVQGISLYEAGGRSRIIQSGGYIETGGEYKEAAMGYTYSVIEYPIKVMWRFKNRKGFQERDFYEIDGLFPGEIRISRGSIVVGINKALEPKGFYVKNRSSLQFKYQELDKK